MRAPRTQAAKEPNHHWHASLALHIFFNKLSLQAFSHDPSFTRNVSRWRRLLFPLLSTPLQVFPPIFSLVQSSTVHRANYDL